MSSNASYLKPEQSAAPTALHWNPDSAISVIDKSSGTVDVVLKIVERCNLACPYCYFFFSGDDSYRHHPPTIPGHTINQLIALLKRAAVDHGIHTMKIGLHGGEPLMMKKKAFRDMCVRFREELGGLCRLFITMQTNGVLIDEEWIDIFAEVKLRVGVSVDGPEHVHNLTRITKKGRGTYAETRRGWELLKAAEAEGRLSFPGLLCVISPDQSGAEAFRHVAFDLRARGVNFLLPDITHDSPEGTEAYLDGCGKFMLDVFKAWTSSKSECSVRFIYEAIGPMLSDESCSRSAISKYDPTKLIVVSSDGEVSPDDVLRGVDHRFRDTGITLESHSFPSIFESGPWKLLSDAQSEPAAECLQCIWFNACKGGSPQNRYSSSRGFDNPSVFCSQLKKLFSTIALSVIGAGYPGSEIERRLETRWTYLAAATPSAAQGGSV